MLGFWVGRLRVVDVDGAFAGENTIEEVADGAALVERWRGAGGVDGTSLFYRDGDGRWRQVWVQAGCVKEKAHDPAWTDGVRFVGTAYVRGEAIADRTTLTPLPDGGVRQVIEYSRDGGAQWAVSFDAYYERVA